MIVFLPDIVTNVLNTIRNIFEITQTLVKCFAKIFFKFNKVWTSLKILQTQIPILTSSQSENFSVEVISRIQKRRGPQSNSPFPKIILHLHL